MSEQREQQTTYKAFISLNVIITFECSQRMSVVR